MRSNIRRRRGFLSVISIVTALGALTACADSENGSASPSPDEDFGLIEGQSTALIATTPSMPNTALENNEFVGFEAEMLSKALGGLGLDYTVTVSDFPGMLAGIQANRQDVAAGNIAWREPRTEAGLFTDPGFYVPQVFAQKTGRGLSSVEDLQGLRVGTISGFIFVDVMKSMEGVELQTYPDATGVLSDLEAGRIDVALMDPLAAIHTAETRPEMDIEAIAVEAPSADTLAAHPEYEIFGPVMTGWYLPLGHEKLRDALNEEIRGMYEDGTTVELMKQYGISNPEAFLSLDPEWAARFEEQRIATDRSAGWTVPQLAE